MKKILLILLTIFTISCTKNWSYKGNSGPQYWGDLKEEFKFCKIGYNQSPIDVKGDFKEEDLKFSYSLSSVEKQRKDYALQIIFNDKNFVFRGKKKYLLRYLSFRHPSEHLVSGVPYSLEMQIAHKSEDEQWLILAIFLEVGKENSAINQLTQLLLDKEKEGAVDLSKIVNSKDLLFFYDGSFTTPPCREGVKWYIMKTPIKISKEQMNVIIKQSIFTQSNARPVQEFHPEKY